MRRYRIVHCVCCRRPATRLSSDEDGIALPLCSECQSPEEVKQYRVRQTWQSPKVSLTTPIDVPRWIELGLIAVLLNLH
jgi:hypothetical protein